MRLAWFSPVPPDRSGIAAYAQEILPLLTPRFGAIDLYIAPDYPPHPGYDGHPSPPPGLPAPAYSVHEFVWRNRRSPYDLTVYQLGNAPCHDYMWAYLFRYPGLVVLHDLQLHQSRALWLLRRLEPRLDDYLTEFRANHPHTNPDAAHLVAAGLGGSLFHLWPMLSLVVNAARLTAVHNARLGESLAAGHPQAAVARIRMGVAPHVAGLRIRARSAEIRESLGIPRDAIVVGAFGGLTPEKRVPELLKAVAALRDRSADVHVMLVGQRADHYEVDADIRALGLGSRVHVTGYVADADLPAYTEAADVCSCLRWPSNGETSASWLRCLAAGKPTIITRLAHLADVPTLEAVDGVVTGDAAGALGVAIDPLDEADALPPALLHLAEHAELRTQLGGNARAWWSAHHRLDLMADDYVGLIDDAHRRPVPRPSLPPHLMNDGTIGAKRILSELGVAALPW